MQNWPAEEIQIAAENEFPTENTEKIRNLIKYWNERFAKMIKEIDDIIDRKKRHMLTKEEADKRIWILYKTYHLFKKYAKRYYEQKTYDLGDQEK